MFVDEGDFEEKKSTKIVGLMKCVISIEILINLKSEPIFRVFFLSWKFCLT